MTLDWRAALARVPYLDLFLYGVVFALGFGLAWGLYRPRAAPPVASAPEVRQKDGSLVLARQPVTPRSAKAAASSLPVIPAGATVERFDEAVLAPRVPVGTGAPDGSAERVRVSVEHVLVKMTDGTERVIVSSPDADVVGGTDFVVSRPVHVERGWGVGGFWNPSTRAWGPKVEKDWGPLRFGITGRVERVQVPGLGSVSNNGADLSVVVHW